MLVLGIETSCDETAAAVVKDGRRVLGSVVATQFELHAVYGGVVPELAARRHLENIAPVIQGALDQAGVGLRDLDGLAATQRPGLIGALVVGMAVAKALAYSLKIPLAGVHHLESHIAALWLTEAPPPCPLVALVVSGGHTNLYRVESLLSMALLSRTRDDAAGEAFDKVAKLMGLGYPGGVVIEALAQTGDRGAFALPRPRIAAEPLTFSYSGLKTAVAHLIKKNPAILTESALRADLAASFQEAVVDSLVTRAWAALEISGCRHLAVCGGVAANGRLRQVLQERAVADGVGLFLPPCRCAPTTPPWWPPWGTIACKAGEHLDLSADVFSRG
jgi:N6-L-threonylcarbamoyladenine synthase